MFLWRKFGTASWNLWIWFGSIMALWLSFGWLGNVRFAGFQWSPWYLDLARLLHFELFVVLWKFYIITLLGQRLCGLRRWDDPAEGRLFDRRFGVCFGRTWLELWWLRIKYWKTGRLEVPRIASLASKVSLRSKPVTRGKCRIWSWDLGLRPRVTAEWPMVRVRVQKYPKMQALGLGLGLGLWNCLRA